MRPFLLTSTCIVALAAPVAAETTIANTVNGPVRTSTVKAGAPDDILINTSGVVNGTAAGGVIIDSNHKLKNDGTIQIGNISNVAGVDVAAGVTSDITLNGKIVVDESYTATDADNDGDLDGPFATGSNRFGIRTNGAMTGNILIGAAGSITVEGNNSAGIMMGGPLTGNFRTDGKIDVLGNNSVGVQLSGVSGNARLAGTISARGENAIAVRSTGDVGGSMVLQGAIVSTGYRFTTPPSDRTKLDADDLLQGGPAVSIEGSVAKGIILAVPPKDQSSTDNDEDDDGIEDAKEGTASIISYGSAAALRIGSAGAITIGATEGTGTGFGLIVDGGILGDGLYAGVDGNALQIGGLGGTVSIANGIGVSGTISAKSFDKNATAVRLGAGTTTPELRNAGKINATSGNTAGSVATAIDIAAGANLPVLRNSGEIKSSTGEAGTAVAIVDKSGTLNLIENSGTISASGAAATSTRNVAIDLSANTTGATIKQTAVGAGFAEPTIVGDIRLGTGSDTLDIADGKLTGNVAFGAGNNRFLLSGDAIASGNLSFGSGVDTITTGGTSVFKGAVDFGGGADVLTIGGTSKFTAQLSNSSGLAVNVQKGTFGVVKSATIASLNVTEGGTLAVTLDKTPGASSMLNVSGSASFGADSKLQLNVADVEHAEGQFVVLNAGTLTGGNNLTANNELLPFLYKGALTVSGNQISVDISRKSATELGLNRSETAAYPAIYEALAEDDAIGDSFLAIRNQEEFVDSIRQMLPDHAGGTFEAVTMGDRTLARMLADPKSTHKQEGNVSYYAAQAVFGSSKSIGETAGYEIGGWGATMGAEYDTKLGKFGGSLSYIWGKDEDKGSDNKVNANQYALAAHWRLQHEGLQVGARASYSYIDFDGKRFFRGQEGGEAIERQIEGSWNGSLFSLAADASQELWAGSFYIRPTAGIEYYRLSEDGYEEEGGGAALDLTVDDRTSDELAVNALLVAGFEMGGYRPDDSFFRMEIEAGRRQIVGGSLGDTTAHFADGDDFTLEPEDRESGWVGRLRGIGGGYGFRIAGELGAEEREEKIGLSARASLVLGL
ncbi:autotransporter outer membrane beta-barrel domain-containing protein [Sphingomonas sp. NSE70-1]|uniref:Autotransporter outer membrane beta-barrel domain-containing protein n=1 Tax=Sphingomonas caseinilyticus TaxID=2908205 RepID=A0ABT0RS72_9SPHN|nr:autotransporter outer membrane beta-barrel domain-containing protein [Sphingomonas caseinilyticus]MCL6697865.1 autotransporter outer membrane beta-barrel domain-containing protein [Sphingomonas caseinilyticus]